MVVRVPYLCLLLVVAASSVGVVMLSVHPSVRRRFQLI